MEEILNSLPEPMRLNTTLLILAAIFLVLIMVLNSLLFKPLVAILDEREQRIRKGEDASRKAEQTVRDSEAAYKQAKAEAIKKARGQSHKLLEESEKLCEEITDTAREQAKDQVRAAATELDQQVQDAKATLKQEASELADQIVSTVLSRKSAA
jgi:F-type H+-transporting ATPase subunit b